MKKRIKASHAKIRNSFSFFKPAKVTQLVKEAIQEWQKDKVSSLAASLAYYTIFSITPLLIISISIAGAIFGEKAARGEIVGQIQDWVGQEGATLIQTALDNASRPDISNFASLISVVVLLFGASGVFAQLQEALNTVWNVKTKPKSGIWNFIRKRILSFSMVLAIGFLLLASLLLSTVLTTLSNFEIGIFANFSFIWGLLDNVVSFGLITLLFALIYRYLPDVTISWKDVWVGATITSLLFGLGKWGLGFYLGRASFASTYGAAGSLVFFLAWVYYSAQILLFGAELTKIYARRYGSQILPDKNSTCI